MAWTSKQVDAGSFLVDALVAFAKAMAEDYPKTAQEAELYGEKIGKLVLTNGAGAD